MRVRRGASSWKVTTPVWVMPWETLHLIRSSGRWVSIVGLELLRLAPDLRREGDRAVVLLRDAGDAVHELRPVLELRELVVRGLERHGHVDRLLHRHPPALAGRLRAAVRLTLVVVLSLVVALGLLGARLLLVVLRLAVGRLLFLVVAAAEA